MHPDKCPTHLKGKENHKYIILFNSCRLCQKPTEEMYFKYARKNNMNIEFHLASLNLCQKKRKSWYIYIYTHNKSVNTFSDQCLLKTITETASNSQDIFRTFSIRSSTHSSVQITQSYREQSDKTPSIYYMFWQFVYIYVIGR